MAQELNPTFAAKAEIMSVVSGELAAYARRNLDDCMAYWVPTSDSVSFGGGVDETAVGIQGWRRVLERDFSQTEAAWVDPGPMSVCNRNSVAWVVYEGSFHWQVGGGALSTKVRSTTILERLDGRWLISHIHISTPDSGGHPGLAFPTSIESVERAITILRPDLTPHTAPNGTISILFSDIVDSTKILERLNDQGWHKVLTRHNQIIRRAIVQHFGYEVKTMGDGFMIAFGSARDAIRCAIQMQRSFVVFPEIDGCGSLFVRIGIHSGEPVKEKSDFYGKSVAKAARIAGAAAGQEILVSSLVKELAEASGEFVFRDRGPINLAGLAGSHVNSEVEWRA